MDRDTLTEWVEEATSQDIRLWEVRPCEDNEDKVLAWWNVDEKVRMCLSAEFAPISNLRVSVILDIKHFDFPHSSEEYAPVKVKQNLVPVWVFSGRDEKVPSIIVDIIRESEGRILDAMGGMLDFVEPSIDNEEARDGK